MNRSELVKTLELIKPALSADNMVPVFQCFAFSKGTVLAYNDNLGIVGPCEFEGGCAIHGNTLLGLLSNSKAEELEIELKGSTATVTCGKTISKLPYHTDEDTIFETPADAWDFQIPFNSSMFEAFQICLETVSSDQTQAALLGITVEGNQLYSCNSDALTRIQMKKGSGKNRILMPTAFCSAVLKLWSSLDMVRGTLKFNDEWIFADFDIWSVYGRVLKIDDPINFDALIKKTVKTEPAFFDLPKGFTEALSRARVFADPESAKTSISLSKGKLQLFTETPMGDVRDDLILKGHPDINASVNASHIQGAVNHCDKIAFLENCTVLKKNDDVFMLVSNR